MDTAPSIASGQTRVAALVAAIPSAATAMADIGYDLGRIALAALTTRPTLRVIGVEVQPEAAKRMAQRMLVDGVPDEIAARFACRTGDGLTPILPGEVDGALMAGMGERTIAEILRAHPATTTSLRWLILCTSHLESTLRPDLRALGWTPTTATIVFENKRFYEVLVARPTTSTNPTPADAVEATWGPELFMTIDRATARAYVNDAAARFKAAIASGFRAYHADSDKQALGLKLALIPEALRRLS